MEESQHYCSLMNLAEGERLIVTVVDHFREKGVFLVSDHTSYGVPVMFVDHDGGDEINAGDSVSADYVSANTLEKGSKSKVVLLLKFVSKEKPGAINMGRPTCLLVRKSQLESYQQPKVLLLQNVNTSSFTSIKFLINQSHVRQLSQKDAEFIRERLPACKSNEVKCLMDWKSPACRFPKTMISPYPRRFASDPPEVVDLIKMYAAEELQARSSDKEASLPWDLPGGRMDMAAPSDDEAPPQLLPWKHVAETELKEEIGHSFEANEDRLRALNFRVVASAQKLSKCRINNSFLLALVDDNTLGDGLFQPNREFISCRWVPLDEAYSMCKSRSGGGMSGIDEQEWLDMFRDSEAWRFEPDCSSEDEAWWKSVVSTSITQAPQTSLSHGKGKANHRTGATNDSDHHDVGETRDEKRVKTNGVTG